MKYLTPQHKQLLELHDKKEWVCSTTIEYMRDHRKRYSELSQKGYTFEAKPCDMNCGTSHSSRLFMRKLLSNPLLNKYQQFHLQKQSETAPNLF